MPERELRSAGRGSEPVTRRLGNCDSTMNTTSAHSGSSDSSYDFLSAEEKECLLFLEETIGSLDTEADSGLSTEESEPVTTPQASRVLPPTQPPPQAYPEKTIIQQAPEPRRETQPSSSQASEPQGLNFKSGSHSLPRNIHISRKQASTKSTAQAKSHIPGESEGLIPEPESKGEPIQVPTSAREATLNLDVVLIPPPEAFRDTQFKGCGEDSLPEGPGQLSSTPKFHTSSSPQKRVEPSSETMSQKANKNGSAGGPGQPQPCSALPSQNARAEEAPLASAGEPNAPLVPLTAPKPRKLPPNIVLKSSRSSFHSDPQNWLSRHSEVAPGDSGLLPASVQEQRKARRQALEKLGLPQDQDETSLHLSKPTSSLRLKESPARATALAPAPAPTQISTAVPASGKAPALTPPLVRGPSPMKALAPAQGPFPMKEPSPGKTAAAKSMPIPIPAATRANSPLSLPKPDTGLTLQDSHIPGLRQMSFKSKTLERSGVGLSSYLSAEKDLSPKTSSSLEKGSFLDKISPSILRNSRPRPASLGTGKDFAGIQVGKLADQEQEQNSKRFSFSGQSRDKLPRPPCVSVKISPKGVPDEHRREALKKLGLLKE
ncbi:PREDICTED: specifically androgen-regulated gene protein [Chrysochloris asiatica]|uniref:Specifically androgen-regulated gene protein n=1 Tax=Chrysochloris asiatica TaxID=185453 RepID=A0A9B0T2D9_CHRAS|nr:PREDICTED: specifically androgen-regulated gene protein [Chrysochloris asiatica]